jgi:hypothetical protein
MIGAASDDVVKGQEIATTNKALIESKAGKSYTTFTVTAATKQVVSGMKWKLKIKVDGDAYIHAEVYIPPGKAAEINEVKQGMTATCAL